MSKKFLLVFAAAIFFQIGIKADIKQDLQQLSFQNEKKDSVRDSLKAKVDSTRIPNAGKKKPSEYETLLKKGGSYEKGVFNVRHIEKKWYFEISDEMLNRMFLAVTRYVTVPQNFSKFPGEEISDNAIYFEKYDDKTIFLRAYTKSKIADSNEDISLVLDRSTNNPIIAKFDVIGKDSVTGARLIDVTNLFMQDNNICGLKGVQGVGALQADRTFIDTIKTYPINVEVSTLRTYLEDSRAARPGAAAAPAPNSGNFMTFTLNTSIVMLPETPMQPSRASTTAGQRTSPSSPTLLLLNARLSSRVIVWNRKIRKPIKQENW